MRRMKVKELVAEAFASVAELPPKSANECALNCSMKTSVNHLKNGAELP